MLGVIFVYLKAFLDIKFASSAIFRYFCHSLFAIFEGGSPKFPNFLSTHTFRKSMKTSFIFREYIWIIETLRREGKVTLRDLSLRWQLNGFGDGQPLSRSSFTRYREAILEIFGIDITCTRGSGFEYYIRNAELLEGNTVQNWMVSTLAIGNIVSDGLNLQQRVALERIPAHSEYLGKFFEAMSSGFCVKIKYRKYGAEEDQEYEIEPYCLKLFKQRWYVLGKYTAYDTGHMFEEPETRMHIFCFDRIVDLTVGDRYFLFPSHFKVEEYFRYAFGVFVDPALEPERILIRAFGTEKYYLDDLPLHESQKKVMEGQDYADYELVLCPTSDFFHQILSRGHRIKVLEPSWVVDEVLDLIRHTLRLYDPSVDGRECVQAVSGTSDHKTPD